MLLEFFGLQEQPFGMTPDPAYLYASRTHSEALDSLAHGIAENRGFFALIAPPGSGKTTLLYHLLEKLRDSSRTVLVFQTQCTAREFIEYILQELGVDIKGVGLVAMHGQLNEILFEELLAGKRFVLVVDEAQNLDDSVLETVRMLSNFETHNAKLLQIILAGQPRLATKLAQPELMQLRQRIGVLTHLDPFNAQETGRYIEHRLQVAGYSGEPIFNQDSILLITRESEGIPRNINNLCYHSLFLAYTRGQRTVTPEIVREVVASLDIEPLARESHADADTDFVAAAEASAAAAEITIPPAAPAVPPIPAAIAPPAEPPVAAPTATAAPVAAFIAAPKIKEVRTPPTLAPSFTPSLTYGAGAKVNPPRWQSRSAILAVTLFSAILFLALLGRSQIKRGLNPAIADPSADALAPLAPAGQPSEGTPAGYNADPQNTENGQIITVMAGPQQTLKDLMLRYVGHFDRDLSSKISSLNPDLKDPDHLEAGQLIRIPLPPGSMKKVNDTADSSAPAEPPPSRNLFTKFTALLHMRR